MQSSSEAVRTQPPRIAKFFILAICFLMLGRADRLHTPDACWRCSRLIQNRSAKSSRDSRAPAHELPPVPLLLSRILGFSFEVIVQLVVQFLVRLRPAKQRPQPQRNREQPMLRSHSDLSYSYRSATIGSVFDARYAGRKLATAPHTTSRTMASASVNGSEELKPNR